METCSAKEQPSFLTHLCCLLSLCQSGVCFGVLSTHLVFGWQLAVVQDSTQCAVCAFYSLHPAAFLRRCCRTRLPAPHVTSACTPGDGGVFFQGGCVCLCLRGLLENVRSWCSPGGRLDRRFLPLWCLLCFSTQSPTLRSHAGKTGAMLAADWGRLISSRVASQQEQWGWGAGSGSRSGQQLAVIVILNSIL